MKRRALYLLIGLTTTIVLCVGHGMIVPRALIDDNLHAFDGEQLAVAAHTLDQARIFFGGSIEPLAVTALRIESVTEAPCYKVIVRAYTIFGLPWSALLFDSCDGAYRVRWGLFTALTGYPEP